MNSYIYAGGKGVKGESMKKHGKKVINNRRGGEEKRKPEE